MRKIEIIGSKSHIHDAGLAVCPLCNSTIHALPTANNSAVEHASAEPSIKEIRKFRGEKND
jgi:hypothetical protein